MSDLDEMASTKNSETSIVICSYTILFHWFNSLVDIKYVTRTMLFHHKLQNSLLGSRWA